MKSLWKMTAPLSELETVASKIISSMDEAFCLWMEGDIGAGKTTLASSLLHRLGLDERVPVTSPTFTYLNEYNIQEKLYAHWDLYRSVGDFSVEDLGHIQERGFIGMIVEWPERLADPDDLVPTHLLRISYLEKNTQRTYELFQK